MSVMPYLRALLSAITLFGGHFLNRRLDRVVLMTALVALCFIVYFGLGWAGVYDKWQFGYLVWIPRILVALLGAILALSIGLTFRDAQRPSGKPPTTAVRVVRVPLTLLGTLVVVITVEGAALVFNTPYTSDMVMFPPTGDRLHFGDGQIVYVGLIAAAPGGREHLRGRITLNGVGIRGAQLTLKLNDTFRVDDVESDSHGGFQVALPAGKWRINDVVVTDWHGRPAKRDLVLVSSHEPLRRAGMYSRFNMETADGLGISLPAAPDSVPLELEYRDTVAITWPPRIGARDVVFSKAAITWQPVNNASEYEIQITHVEHESGGPVILTRRISGLSLPLASLPQKTASAAEDEYSVHMFAFDARGHFLTESGDKSSDRRFVLTGTARLAGEQQYVGFDGPRIVFSDEYEANQKRLDSAESLLRQKRLEDARIVLNQVTKDAPAGRATGLLGRLAALKGDCVTATRLFNQAEKEGACICDADRQLCPNP